MKREDWLAKLDAKNGTSTMTYAENHQNEIDKQKAKFMAEVKAGRMPKIMYGAFGPETTDSDAYIEEEILDNGHAYKLYGCTALYRGTFDDHIVHGIQLGKSLLSYVPREFLRNKPIALALLFMYLFQRKRLLKAIDFLFGQIEWKVMRWYDIPETHYNSATREIKRCVALATEDNLWGNLVRKITNFLCLVLETDNAYRLRLQDAFPAAHLLYGSAYTVFNVLDVLTSRETAQGIGHKWRFNKLLLRIALLFSPTLSKIIQRTLINLDIEKLKMDENDWYFCLKFKSYNFKGMNEEARLNFRDNLDKHYGTIYFI